MKTQILENLVKGYLGFDSFLRLVFTRVIKVIAVCLGLTLVVWLVWLGKFTLASFLAGAIVGIFVFLILGFLKRCLGGQKTTENSDLTEKSGKLSNLNEVKPKASVED